MTKKTYDSIWVITDRLTKYGYFIPYIEASTAKDLAYAFTRVVIANHGVPKTVISDRGTIMNSKFWKTLTARLGIRWKPSTAYHPQTDGQTERLNQTLEQYLRCYVDQEQDNWVSLLPLAQFAYNSAENSTTKMSPFYANYGYNPEPYRDVIEKAGTSLDADTTARKIKGLQEQLRRDISFYALRMKQYHDKGRRDAPTLKRGDKVYLLRRNIRTKRPSNKLDFKKIGPFKILEKRSTVNYKLELPKGMRIHPVFHISLLEPAPKNAKIQTDIEVEPDEGEYEVEEILDRRVKGRQEEYLIKWKGYDDSENTWEPRKHLRNCPEKLHQFHQRNPGSTNQDLTSQDSGEPDSTRRDQRRATKWQPRAWPQSTQPPQWKPTRRR